MRVAILTASAAGSASRYLARPGLPEVERVGALLDARRPAARARMRKLQRVGPSGAAAALLLRRVYRRDAPALDEVAERVWRVPSLNGVEAQRILQELAPDLALSIGAPILHEATFSLPRLGTVNVHQGEVPRFRGRPPLFWELAEGLETVGYTVHAIDAGLDTGPILAAGDVPVEFRPTLAKTVRATLPVLEAACFDALDRVLAGVAAAGRLEGRSQTDLGAPARTTPRLGDLLRASRAVRRR